MIMGPVSAQAPPAPPAARRAAPSRPPHRAAAAVLQGGCAAHALSCGPQRWCYACAKQLVERLVYAHGTENDLKFTIVRPYNWIGPRMDYIPGVDGKATSEHTSPSPPRPHPAPPRLCPPYPRGARPLGWHQSVRGPSFPPRRRGTPATSPALAARRTTASRACSPPL